MKKLICFCIVFSFLSFSYAQDGGGDKIKNFRFGLKFAPDVNWYKPDEVKKFENSGMVFKFSWGLAMEFRLSSILSLATGLELKYDGGKLKFLDTANYVFSKDEIIMLKDTAGKNYDVYKLNERKYNVNYAQLPFAIKMKTKEIGYMTYFGQFGLITSIRTKAKVDDKVYSYKSKQPTEQSKLDITDDMNLFKFALTIGGGAEYNLAGSTSFTFGISYNHGISNVLKKESDYLFRKDLSAVKQKAAGKGVALALGVLF